MFTTHERRWRHSLQGCERKQIPPEHCYDSLLKSCFHESLWTSLFNPESSTSYSTCAPSTVVLWCQVSLRSKRLNRHSRVTFKTNFTSSYMLNIARRWRSYYYLASLATTAVIDAPVFTVVIGQIYMPVVCCWNRIRVLCLRSSLHFPRTIYFCYQKLKNDSCEYNRLNGWNSTLQAAWYIRLVRIICFLWTKPTIWFLILSFTQNIVHACSMFYPYEGYKSVTPLDAARVNRTIFHNHYVHWCYITPIKGRCYIKHDINVRHGKRNPRRGRWLE